MAVQTEEGTLIPRLEEVMDFLSTYHPPLRFPADGGRREVEAAPRWLRGGTSPSGRDFGNVAEATWFVGETYLQSSYGTPQRIVWLPPEIGQERFVEADRAGYSQERETVGGEGPDLGARSFRRVMTRVCPTIADIWANDYGDLDLLVHWLASAVFCTNPGGPEAAGEKPVEAGGGVPVQHGQRGLRYQLHCNFVFPISAPYMEMYRTRSVSVDARVEPESAAVARARAEAAIRLAERDRGVREPHDIDRTPWRRTSIAPPPRPALPEEE